MIRLSVIFTKLNHISCTYQVVSWFLFIYSVWIRLLVLKWIPLLKLYPHLQCDSRLFSAIGKPRGWNKQKIISINGWKIIFKNNIICLWGKSPSGEDNEQISPKMYFIKHIWSVVFLNAINVIWRRQHVKIFNAVYGPRLVFCCCSKLYYNFAKVESKI